MKIYTDRPEMLPPGHIPVESPDEADAVVVFTPKFLRNGPTIRNKTVLLVAKRTPLSLAGMGIEIRLSDLSDLPDVLLGGFQSSRTIPELTDSGRQEPDVAKELVRATGKVPAEEPVIPEPDQITSQQFYNEPEKVISDPVKKREVFIGPAKAATFCAPPEKIENLYVSYSPGTNVGKTFVASNMAAWLADQGMSAVLVDMDSVNSGTWEMLHMREMFGPPKRTIADWNGAEEDIWAMAEEHAHPGVKNLYVLIRGNTCDPEKLTAALYALSKRYQVVVDTSNDIELPHIASALFHAEKIFFIGTLTLKVQSRFSQMYSNARRLAAGSRLILAVNRVGLNDNEKNLKPVDLARQFGFRDYHVVHEDRKARLLAEKKKTLPLFVNSNVSTELKAMFSKEFGFAGVQKKSKTGLFSLFKRRDA